MIQKIKSKGDITLYRLSTNDLEILFVPRKNSGVITSNIVYRVGSRDEARGETGIAHMLEHMLFKPTLSDIKRKTESGAMKFERETGITLNANTWKDRTTYFFSYPKEHFERALQIESERMHGVKLSNKEFFPERTNVLSEFDMYAGNEQFALSVQMMGVAFQSHQYGHETIGYREDIEAYTVDKLRAFYEMYYAPNNATLVIVGDVDEKSMKEIVLKHFGKLKKSLTLKPRFIITEPKQEGERVITISRQSTTQVYAIGIKHEAFPSKDWFQAMAILEMLAGGEDSILHKKLVDTGLATNISTSLEPTRENNLAILYITLTPKSTHESIHIKLKNIISLLTLKEITAHLKKTIAKVVTSEFKTRESGIGYSSELVEYVSAYAWEQFFDSEKILLSINSTDIKLKISNLFKSDQITIGYFKGTK